MGVSAAALRYASESRGTETPAGRLSGVLAPPSAKAEGLATPVGVVASFTAALAPALGPASSIIQSPSPPPNAGTLAMLLRIALDISASCSVGREKMPSADAVPSIGLSVASSTAISAKPSSSSMASMPSLLSKASPAASASASSSSLIIKSARPVAASSPSARSAPSASPSTSSSAMTPASCSTAMSISASLKLATSASPTPSTSAAAHPDANGTHGAVGRNDASAIGGVGKTAGPAAAPPPLVVAKTGGVGSLTSPPIGIAPSERHRRWMHVCFFRPSPPNQGMSKQFEHRPQFVEQQPSHTPQRRRRAAPE